MEIWHYIESLNRTDFPTEQKTGSLDLIAEEGNPSHIYYLFNLLRDENKAIRDKSCDTILALFYKIKNKREYADALKHCPVSDEDLAFYRAHFSVKQYVELLAVGSLNSNGYIRQSATEKLAGISHPRAIPFLVYRLADWVAPVREAAKKGIENYMTSGHLEGLIQNLPLFEWIKQVERVNLKEIHRQVIEFIAIENRASVLERFRSYPDPVRLLLAQHLSASLIDLHSELKYFLSDNYFRVRLLALDYFDKLEPAEIDRLLHDKSAKVRLQTLYALKERADITEIALEYLADDSASIRHFARFILKHSEIDFASYYYNNLENGQQINGSLTGLAELEAKHYSGILKKYLESPRTTTRVAAFLALRKLDKPSASEFALENLGTASGKLRNAIIEHLSFLSRKDVLEKARHYYQTGDYELKRSMILLFGKMGGWSILADLMTGTVAEDERLRNLSQQFIETWRKRAVHLFTTPQQEDLERAKQTLALTFELHEKNRYFNKNPLSGIDFFLN